MKVLTARVSPEASASTGRGRQLRWKEATAAMKAPKAELAAEPGPRKVRPKAMTRASPAPARRAISGSSRVRSTVSPDRAVSFRARSQLMGRA